MDVMHPRCAGIDCSKKDAKVCIRVQGQGRRATAATVTTWGATTRQILALREHLLAANVTCVVIESTSDYWKPFYYLLDDELDVVLVNAASVRNLPGRKTDVSDAAWLADLGAHGLVKASFVPPAPIRALRDLTRTRTVITRERTRDVQRLEKLLEDRDQTVLGGLRHHRCLRARHVGGADRWTTRPRRTRRSGPTPDAVEDPGLDRSADRTIQRPPRIHGATVSGPHRRPHRRHRST
jgi:transposase